VLYFRAATEQTEPGLRYRLPWPIQSHEIGDLAQVRRAEVECRTAAEVPQGAAVSVGDSGGHPCVAPGTGMAHHSSGSGVTLRPVATSDQETV
jgi:hypothetical protein